LNDTASDRVAITLVVCLPCCPDAVQLAVMKEKEGI